ncbi:hypothetical protein FB45DRAFT_941134 [Roridomyces roridus]|uniref:BTB domain-containing protein n=1 Tax=Roridomyces roridus TaxID=1738132 RepID=A0AAD7FD47_9AGAR|nr:hypothetical protein FB45DRAFT_957980 [Roridomyces roridus]KAJ7611835.1 hypothetical protein FB45DRAFT_941134 [Roridomyces roridus]
MQAEFELVRVNDLWFDDGGIVIQAQNCLFRVSRAILAARSTVFKDLFCRPESQENCESLDGCPILRLPDCSAEVTVFFKAIFNSEFFEPYPARTDLDTIIGVLRLSHKYQIPYLRRRALVHLSSGYRSLPPVINDDSYLPKGGSWTHPSSATDLLRLVHLARQVSVLWILPPIFYALASDFALPEVVGNTLYQTLINEEDRNNFLQGAGIQSGMLLDSLRFLYEPPTVAGCTGRENSCAIERLRALEKMRVWFAGRGHGADPLHLWTPDEWAPLMVVCSVCFEVILRGYVQGRQAIWNRLPEMYGLPEWAELEQMRDVALG